MQILVLMSLTVWPKPCSTVAPKWSWSTLTGVTEVRGQGEGCPRAQRIVRTAAWAVLAPSKHSAQRRKPRKCVSTATVTATSKASCTPSPVTGSGRLTRCWLTSLAPCVTASTFHMAFAPYTPLTALPGSPAWSRWKKVSMSEKRV